MGEESLDVEGTDRCTSAYAPTSIDGVGFDAEDVELKRAGGKTLRIQKTTRAEPRQQRIYDALGIADRPGQTEKTVI